MNLIYSIFYTIKNNCGETVITNENDEPLEIVPGNGQIFPIIEDKLSQMRPGEQISMDLNPDEAFGTINNEAIATIPLLSIPEDLRHQGAEVSFEMEDNTPPYLGIIKKVDGDYATIDFNHPLAGQIITINLTLVESAPTQ